MILAPYFKAKLQSMANCVAIPGGPEMCFTTLDELRQKFSWPCKFSNSLSLLRDLQYVLFSNQILTPRDDSRLAPSQWKTSLHSNAVSRWLGAHLESAAWLRIAGIISRVEECDFRKQKWNNKKTHQRIFLSFLFRENKDLYFIN